MWINESSRVFVARHGRHELTPTILTGDEVRELVDHRDESDVIFDAAAAWSELAPIQGELLDVADRGGLAAALVWLDERGIGYTLTPAGRRRLNGGDE